MGWMYGFGIQRWRRATRLRKPSRRPSRNGATCFRSCRASMRYLCQRAIQATRRQVNSWRCSQHRRNSLTEGREVINPRPLDESAIFQLYRNNTRGVITYSEGCNDDVNKMIWSSHCWDPDARTIDILHDYSRYFIGDKYTDDFADGLLAL